MEPSTAPTDTDRRRGVYYILAAAVLWGTTGTAQALGPDTATPLTVGAVRMMLGGVTLVVVAAAARRLAPAKVWLDPAVLISAGAMAAYQPFFFSGIVRTGVAVGTIVALGSAPILAAVLARIVRGEVLDRAWRLATALAVVGVTLLAIGGETIGVDPVGVLLALGAGASYAVYAVAVKSVVEDLAPITSMSAIFGWAALILSPVLLFADIGWVTEPGGLAIALHLGIVTTAVAYLLFARGLAVTPVATAATLTLAEPATAALLGVSVLNEQLTGLSWLGLALVAAGLIILTRRGQTARATAR